MSRPEKQIDWKKVDAMLEAHCNGTEIAAQFGMHPDTFYKRVEKEYNMGFSEYFQQKKATGKSNLKFAQYKKALGGNTSIQIWLGKNWLGQREEPKEEKEFDGKLSVLLDKLLKIENPEDFKNKEDKDGTISE